MDARPKAPSTPAEQRVRTLERLLAREGAALRRQARRNSLTESDAEDALQDGCVRFLRYFDGEESYAAAWLMLTVKRCAWKLSERVRRFDAHERVATVDPLEIENEIVLVDERSGPEDLAERSAAVAFQVEMLDQLKPDERTTLILIGLGATYKEIAQLRGWSARKVERCAIEGRARLNALVERGEE